MDMLWEEFQRILHIYMKPINFQLKASVVCSVTTAIDILMVQPLQLVNWLVSYFTSHFTEYVIAYPWGV